MDTNHTYSYNSIFFNSRSYIFELFIDIPTYNKQVIENQSTNK